MPLMFDVMVSGGRLDGSAFVRLNRLEPARVHGLQGKGDIATGFDADIVIRDPKRHVTFGADDLHDNVGYTPREGRTVTGWEETVFLLGVPGVESGAFAGFAGAGLWLKRDDLGVSSAAEPAREYWEATE